MPSLVIVGATVDPATVDPIVSHTVSHTVSHIVLDAVESRRGDARQPSRAVRLSSELGV